MATLTVRDVNDDVYECLKRRVKENGRSLEAEVRQILKRAIKIHPRESRDRMERWLRRDGGWLS